MCIYEKDLIIFSKILFYVYVHCKSLMADDSTALFVCFSMMGSSFQGSRDSDFTCTENKPATRREIICSLFLLLQLSCGFIVLGTACYISAKTNNYFSEKANYHILKKMRANPRKILSLSLDLYPCPSTRD